MKRREFMKLVGGGIASCVLLQPLSAANRNRRVTGFFTVPLNTRTELTDAFRTGLRELGYIPGTNITLEFKSTDGNSERIDQIAKEIISENNDVVVTWGTQAVSAMQRASKTTPIVMAAISDPVAAGIVASFAHPGGNITGFTLASTDLAAKRTQMVKDFIPHMQRIGFLSTPDSGLEDQFQEIYRAAKELGVEAKSFSCQRPTDIRNAIGEAAEWRADGLITSTAALFAGKRIEISNLSLDRRIALAGPTREFAVAGALFCYGPSINDTSRRAASYVDKILKGESPANLPIQRPDRFDLVINLTTAKALGLNVPPTMLSRADEVIE